MLRFNLFGIPISIQPFFWLIMAFLGGGMDLLSNPTQKALIYTLIFMAAGFISILIHELGHAFMMQKNGRHPQIVLHGMGGVAMSSGSPLSRMNSILVSLAGPIFQIILGGIAFGVYKFIGAENFPTDQSRYFVFILAMISFFWAIVNLIPIHPLDGGQILSAILGPKHERLVSIIAIVIGVLLIAGLYFTGYGSLWNYFIVVMLVWGNVKTLGR